MRRTFFALGATLILSSVPALGQIRAIAPGGVLSGVVRDSATGEPVGYALIVTPERNQRVFATAAGRFRLTGLTAGPASLRVQQIGYRGVTLAVIIDRRTSGVPAEPELVISLVRRPLVLPELVSRGDACLGMQEAGGAAPEGGTILDEAYKNAERILTLEQRFPFVLRYQRSTAVFDSSYAPIGGAIDTVRKDSRTFATYRAGRVLDRSGTRLERVNAFTTSGIAGGEFQRTHCFWYAGRDSVGGFPAYRIEFAPSPDVRTTDWAGSILVDSASMSLLKAEARVVNLPARGTGFLSVICTFFYRPILPSLPQEHETKCVSTLRGPPKEFMVERWLLVDRAFIGKTPGASLSPEGDTLFR
jgi:carboxypeptidase family protein